MDDVKLRIELDQSISKLIQNFAGKEINQLFITEIWLAIHDEITHFNTEKMNLSKEAIEWIHSYYVNHVIKIQTTSGPFTIGQLSTQSEPPNLSNVSIEDLSKMKKIFDNTSLENSITKEIQNRNGEKKNGTNFQKQITRSNKFSNN